MRQQLIPTGLPQQGNPVLELTDVPARSLQGALEEARPARKVAGRSDARHLIAHR